MKNTVGGSGGGGGGGSGGGGGGATPVLRSSSDPAIPNSSGTWELSLAAGSASKDKRVKDVKNTNLKNHQQKKRQFKIDDISLLTHGDGECRFSFL